MVKEIQFLKIKWFKNDTKECGAQAECFKHRLENQISIKSETKKMGKLWGNVTPNQLLHLLEKNHGIYELLYTFPQKVYFDIDTKDDTEYNETQFNNYIDNILSHIEHFFPNADAAVSGSNSKEKKSLHITLQNYIIHNEDERQHLKHIVNYIQTNTCKDFDKVVYNNRPMKAINQSKVDGRVQTIIRNNDYKAHCITCFTSDYSLPFINNIPQEIKENIDIEKSKTTFDLSTLPKLNLKIDSNVDFFDLTPIDILGLLPINKSFNHSYTHLIARFCFYNNISFELFLAWIKPKHIEKNKNLSEEFKRWEWHWTRLEKYPPVSVDKIKTMLCHFYPHLKKDIHYRKFCDSFGLYEPIQKIPTISQKEFNTNDKYAIFNIGMGGGKTFQTVEYLTTQSSFCWLAPNRALAHNTFNRLEEANINISHYDKFKTKDKKNGCLKEHNKLIIVANSLHYLFDTTYDVIVIDEIETLIDKWFGNFMTNKTENWNVFLNIIRQAKKVILLDAFITTKTLNLIKTIDPTSSKIIFERISEPSIRTINYIADFEIMINNIIEDLKNNLKLFIFYPYKNQSKMYNNVISMDNLYKLLVDKTGKDGIFYNADIDDKIKIGLKNVNTAWDNKKFIITNSMITCGVNYEKEDFDKEYLFISSFSVPRDVVQVSYRPRHLTSNIINVSYIGKMTQVNTWETDTHLMNCPIYHKMTNDILIEKKSPLKKTFQLFCNKAHYKQITDKNRINEQLQNETNKMLKEYGMGFSFMGIPDIDFSFEEILQEKLFAGEATMIEKFMLQKYHFKNKFTHDSQFETLGKEINYGIESDILALEFAWDNQFNFFFEQIRRDLANPKSIFKKIKEFNSQGTEKCTDLFFNDITKIKLNDDILQQIFLEFKFKYISKVSNTKIILKDIYNSYFGRTIIRTFYDENKHTYYEIDAKSWNYWYDFVSKFNKESFVEIENGEDCDLL